MTSVKSYRNYVFSSGCTTGSDYQTFERRCKFELNKMGKERGFNLHTFHKNHYEWTAVLEKNGKFIYVSISDVRYFDNWYDHVLVRTMAHEKDWHGGYNNFTSWDNVIDLADKLIKG